jgi:hypothetical protein
MQNLAVLEFSMPQEGQRHVKGDAHSPQNFARSGFSAPHLEQRIAPLQIEPYLASGPSTREPERTTNEVVPDRSKNSHKQQDLDLLLS